MREVTHLNGGKEWFGYIHRCVEQPRLTRKDVYTRKNRSVTSEFRVDGVVVASLKDAIAALDLPPSLSLAERAILASVNDDPEDRRKEAFSDGGPNDLIWHFLCEKGLIEWAKGRVARTEAGRQALKPDRVAP